MAPCRILYNFHMLVKQEHKQARSLVGNKYIKKHRKKSQKRKLDKKSRVQQEICDRVNNNHRYLHRLHEAQNNRGKKAVSHIATYTDLQLRPNAQHNINIIERKP